jgi:aminoglycoside phosphotransferase (APT) family kinase protein
MLAETHGSVPGAVAAMLTNRARHDDGIVQRRTQSWGAGPVAPHELLAVELPDVEQHAASNAPLRSDDVEGPAPDLDSLLELVRRRPRAGAHAVGLNRAVRLSGGYSKLMVAAEVQWDDGTSEPVVLRTVAPGRSSGGLRQEHEVLRFLFARGYPVPEPWWYDDRNAPTLATSLVPGRTRGDVNGWESSPDAPALAALAQTLVGLHQLDVTELSDAPLPDLVSTDDRRAAVAERRAVLQGLWATGDDAWAPLFNLVLDWLLEHLPDDSPSGVLVHGDFGPHNVMLLDGSAIVTAVLDWERAHRGAAVEDLAYLRPTLDQEAWIRFLDHYSAATGSAVDPLELHWYLVWQDLWRAVSAYRMRHMFLSGRRGLTYAVSGLVLAPRFLDRAVCNVAAEGEPC